MGSGGPTFSKRQREQKRARKKRDKAERREQRKKEREREARHSTDEGEDPDIAGIVPGPQPLPWEDEDLPGDDELSSEDEES